MLLDSTDFLVIGGGIIGLNLALHIQTKFKDCQVTLIEKEKDCGLHASGRNSGVLHAGFYYTADSLKARFTREGNRELTDFCVNNNLHINRCGKLVVTQSEAELDVLEELKNRGKNNGVQLEYLSDKEAKEIEPRIKTVEKALFSPNTSSVDPVEVMRTFYRLAEKVGISILKNTKYIGKKQNTVFTNNGSISSGYVINAAGLYADRIAMDYGFSKNYRILPFKGIYLYGEESLGSIRTNVYPVPDLNNPFLGVHFTLTHNGKIKIGPTAIPAFWKEQYNGLSGFKLNEFVEVALRELGLFLKNEFGFRDIAFVEMKKYYKPYLLKIASKLIEDLNPKKYNKWGTPGIRAQLINIKENKLEMDFIYEGDKKSFHILNAVSPAFTCAIPFTRFLVEKIEKLIE